MTTIYPGDSARYPGDSARDGAIATAARGDIEQAYSFARRHSRRVRWLRFGVLAAIAAVMLVVVGANYLPNIGEFPLPGELGKLVLKGTKIAVQQPKLTGYTNDARAYEFTADVALQDITKPDMVELEQLHAKMDMADKSTVEMTAPTGNYDMKANILTLHDDIALASSTGYAARLTEAVVDVKNGNVVSDQPVKVKLLNGFLNANRMQVVEKGDVVRFEGGVFMTLQPDKNSEKATSP